MPDLAAKLSNISPTFFHDFLSPEEENTLFLNDLEEEFVFFLVIWIFYWRKLAKIPDSFELTVPRCRCDGIRRHFRMKSTTFELLTNLLAPSEHKDLVGCPLNKENRWLRLSGPWWTNRLAVRYLIVHFSPSTQGRGNWAALLHEQDQFGQNQFSQFSELARSICGRTSLAGQFWQMVSALRPQVGP